MPDHSYCLRDRSRLERANSLNPPEPAGNSDAEHCQACGNIFGEPGSDACAICYEKPCPTPNRKIPDDSPDRPIANRRRRLSDYLDSPPSPRTRVRRSKRSHAFLNHGHSPGIFLTVKKPIILLLTRIKPSGRQCP